MSSIDKTPINSGANELLSVSLATAGLISEDQLSRATAMAVSSQSSLIQALLKLGLIEEEVLLPLAAKTCQLPYLGAEEVAELHEAALSELSHPFCSASSIVPIQAEDGHPVILITDPSDERLVEEIAFHLCEAPKFAVAPSRTIRLALKRAQQEDGGEKTSISGYGKDYPPEAAAPEADGPTIRFVDQLFADAVGLGASDVHFESTDHGVNVRFRLDGTLVPQSVERQLDRASILARIKVMANLNVSERRLPQDGRITKNVAGRLVDFRVSSVPTNLGESIVCRILDPNALRLGWEALGFSCTLRDQIIDIIEQPSGLFLVTGPTGSGKTTTLYTALAHLNRPDCKILTVEDPVEYSLPGIQQVQVHEDIGLTFAKALRAFLRQDPNIVMIGEIRDEETAQIASRAAMIGRMVLSTLHTGAPEDAMPRLVDLGVPEFLVRDVLKGAMGQQLVPRPEGGRRVEARLVDEFK